MAYSSATRVVGLCVCVPCVHSHMYICTYLPATMQSKHASCRPSRKRKQRVTYLHNLDYDYIPSHTHTWRAIFRWWCANSCKIMLSLNFLASCAVHTWTYERALLRSVWVHCCCLIHLIVYFIFLFCVCILVCKDAI